MALARDHSGFACCRKGLLEFGEDDDAGARLEKALDLDFYVLADGGLAVVNDDHGAVGQVTDTLAFVFAFANYTEGKHFAGQ